MLWNGSLWQGLSDPGSIFGKIFRNVAKKGNQGNKGKKVGEKEGKKKGSQVRKPR